MKIISHLLPILVLTTTSIATGVVLFSSSPAQAVNLIKNGDYGGTVDFPWEGNAYPNPDGGGYGTIFQLLSSSTDPLKQYRLSFDFQPSTLINLNVSLGATNLVSLSDSSPSTFDGIFSGNGSNKLSFNYQLVTPYQSLSLKNLSFDDLSAPDPTAPATSAPEPLTIVGTIIGGTAAFRLKKRLESSKKGTAS